MTWHILQTCLHLCALCCKQWDTLFSFEGGRDICLRACTCSVYVDGSIAVLMCGNWGDRSLSTWRCGMLTIVHHHQYVLCWDKYGSKTQRKSAPCRVWKAWTGHGAFQSCLWCFIGLDLSFKSAAERLLRKVPKLSMTALRNLFKSTQTFDLFGPSAACSNNDGSRICQVAKFKVSNEGIPLQRYTRQRCQLADVWSSAAWSAGWYLFLVHKLVTASDRSGSYPVVQINTTAGISCSTGFSELEPESPLYLSIPTLSMLSMSFNSHQKGHDYVDHEIRSSHIASYIYICSQDSSLRKSLQTWPIQDKWTWKVSVVLAAGNCM